MSRKNGTIILFSLQILVFSTIYNVFFCFYILLYQSCFFFIPHFYAKYFFFSLVSVFYFIPIYLAYYMLYLIRMFISYLWNHNILSYIFAFRRVVIFLSYIFAVDFCEIRISLITLLSIVNCVRLSLRIFKL